MIFKDGNDLFYVYLSPLFPDEIMPDGRDLAYRFTIFTLSSTLTCQPSDGVFWLP
jgi:hypothetical protein